ncbi:MAG: D-glycero-D-manno-heptose 1,7-bisphosphate phosphatase [Methyloprofundus sp.]|nr:MAG: D-glycero-D-manno-heptose 1,7-bisphosphate phosphatase [Methyloprofundus sp.]
MNKALFLDRDGVINIEKEYLYKIADFEFIEGVFDTCQYFQDQGYLIIIITNQAGIARGKYTENDFANLTQWMLEQFTQKGILISQVYHCPHHPSFTGDCPCRKPNPGMLIEAQQAFKLDLDKSILVGDKESDIQAGINAGIQQNILVRSGHLIDETNSKATQIIDSIKDLPALFQ